MTHFGDFIRARREDLRKRDPAFSLRRVAVRLGVQPAYLSRVEREGTCALTETHTRALAEILNIDPDLLLVLSGKMPEALRQCAFEDPEGFAERLRALREPFRAETLRAEPCQPGTCPVPACFNELSPALAQRIMDTLPDMVFWADVEGRYLYVNDAALTSLGYSRGEVLGRSAREMHTQAVLAWAPLVAELRAKGTVKKRALLDRKDGGRIPADLSSFLLPYGEDGIIVCVARDMTERVRMEFDRKLARHAFETAPSMILWVTEDCRIVDANLAAARELGYTREELLATSPLAVHVQRNAENWAELWDMAREKRTLVGETMWARKDGTLLPVELRGNLLEFDGREYAVVYAHDISERQAMERNLRLSQVTVERAADMIFWVDEDGGIFNVNLAACAALGYERKELLGKRAWEVNLKRTPENWPESWEALGRQGAVGMESVFRRKNGGTFSVEVNSSLVEHEGRFLMVSIARDITERRRMEERLSLQQHTLSRVPDMVFWAREDGRLMSVNPAAANGLGFSEDELLSMHVWDVDPDSSPERWAMHWSLFLQQGTKRGEARLRRQDGSIVTLEVIGSAVRHQGRPMVVAVCRDVTERKALEERLGMTQHAVDHAPEAIFWNGPDGRFLDCNHAGLEMCGYTREEMLNLCVEDVVPSAPGHTWASRWQATRDRGTVNVEEWLHRKDGTVVPVDISVEYQQYAGREFNVAFVRDVTERKQGEQRLLAAKRLADAASRAKSEFLANMSHEIRTPLNGVLGMLQVLETTGLDAGQRDCVETALLSGRSLLSLINDILDFSKVEAGKLSIADEPYAPESVVALVRSIFLHQATAKGLTLEARIDPSLPEMVRGDSGRLRQVLFNLLGNAVKFTHKGGIRLCAWAEEADETRVRLCFSVADTGIGIPADKLEQVFEAFVQVEGDIARNYQGTGLGLSIVRRLVGLMGGEVRLESELGRGSTVHFSILAGRVDAKPAGDGLLRGAGQLGDGHGAAC